MQTLQINSTLQSGKYTIKKVLGQGGFGITYLAEHNLLGTKVAIKEFFMKELNNRDESTSQVSVGSDGSRELVMKFRDKFIKEARNIARLNHPNIIRIHDIFEENGTAYYVMEYCEGESLNELLKKHPEGLGEALAVKYIRQVASALQYIHERKMNHLDVKPANIMLNAGNAVLIDFGLSKQYDSAGSQTSTTPVGISHGFAPIEQYKQGGVCEFSPATDIYSLGATFYKLITGHTPPEAQVLLEEELPAFNASDCVINAINHAMLVKRSNRPQSIEDWLSLLPDESESIAKAREDLLINELKNSIQEKKESLLFINEAIKQQEELKIDLQKQILEIDQIISAKQQENNELRREIENLEAKLKEIENKSVSNSVLGNTDVTIAVEAEERKTIDENPNTTKAVDLGLPSGIKWANCNLGANSPYDAGMFFSWGETKDKNVYYDFNYFDRGTKSLVDSFFSGQNVIIQSSLKYNLILNKSKIPHDSEDDAAFATLGNHWHLPESKDFEELITCCKWEFIENKESYKVIGPNGNHIVFPLCGSKFEDHRSNSSQGCYWTSELTEKDSLKAVALIINRNSNPKLLGVQRYFGYNIRPVYSFSE